MSETAKREPTPGAARHLVKTQPGDYRTGRIARCWGQEALPGDSAGGSETPDGGRLALQQFFGQADSTLPDLQADFPGYLIAAEYRGLPGFCYIAKRIGGGDGPYLDLPKTPRKCGACPGAVLVLEAIRDGEWACPPAQDGAAPLSSGDVI